MRKHLFQYASWIFFIVFLSFTDKHLQAQTPRWVNLSTTQSINGVAEEGNYLWFATGGGLVRWDKTTQTRTFYNQSGHGSLMTNIRTIAIDQNGMKWLGTDNMGLVTFDGTNVTTRNRYTLPSWKYDKITSIVIDRFDNKWMASTPYLLKMDPAGIITEYPISDAQNINVLAIDSSGLLWVGASAGLYQFDGTFKKIEGTGAVFPSDQNVTGIGIGPGGLLYVGSYSPPLTNTKTGGFYTLQGSTFKQVHGFGYEILSLHVHASGMVTVGHAYGIGTYDGTTVKDNSLDDRPTVVFRDSMGDTWFGSVGASIKKGLDKNAVEIDLRTSTLSENLIGQIAIENGTEAWVGTNGFGGLHHFKKNGVCDVYNGSNTKNLTFDVQGLLIDSRGYKWISSKNGYVGRLNEKSFITYPDIWKFANSWTGNIREDAAGNLWMGISGALVKYDRSKWTIYNSSTDWPNSFGYGPFETDNQGLLWMLSYGAMYTYDGKSWIFQYSVPDEYYRFHIDKFNNKWFAGRGVVARRTGTSFVAYTKNNFPLAGEVIQGITTDPAGVLWCGYEGGSLTRFDGTKWTVLPAGTTGIPSVNITALKADAAGNVWIGTDHGLVVYNEMGVNLPLPEVPSVTKASYFVSPRLGDTLQSCTTSYFQRQDVVNETGSVWLSADSGATWQFTGRFYKNGLGIPFTAPALSSDVCKMRLITEPSNDTLYSTGYFVIQNKSNASIEMVAPRGTEYWKEGEEKSIQWTFTGNMTAVSLHYSPDLGITWNTIASNIPNTGSFSWKVPTGVAKEYLIRVTEGNSGCASANGRVVPGNITGLSTPAEEGIRLYPNPSGSRVFVKGLRSVTGDFVIVNAQGIEVPFEKKISGELVEIVLRGNQKGLFCMVIPGSDQKSSWFVIE